MRARALPSLLLVPLVLAACTAPGGGDGPSPSGNDTGAELVLASASENDSLNPLMGYAPEGASKIFDGLVSRDAQLRLQPALGASLPEPDATSTTWTVDLRPGVTFHDGTTFEAGDVVATYSTLLDPVAASPMATTFSMLDSVEALDDDTVRFHLDEPYAPFAQLLTLGILPSERLEEDAGQPVSQSSLGTEPVGTGPYRLAEWRRGQHMVLEANEDYWAGAPEVQRITVVTVLDDNARAQRVSAGEIDGAVLPPALAETFDDEPGYEVVHHDSADYRTVVLPSGNPVTGDAAVREALNLVVDRQAMVDTLLTGRGEPAYTPIPQALTEYAATDAVFAHDPQQAASVLDEAGWVVAEDGARARDGVRAAFTLMYPAGDTIRRNLATAVAQDAETIGIEIALEGLGWDAIEPRMARDAVLFASGSSFDPDLAMYQALHSSFAADGFNNPGSYANPQVDAALDRGRAEHDPEVRAEAYRQAQRAFVDDPGLVFLVFLDHSYVLREGWAGYQPIVEPHVHGVTWGPWWNVEAWTRE